MGNYVNFRLGNNGNVHKAILKRTLKVINAALGLMARSQSPRFISAALAIGGLSQASWTKGATTSLTAFRASAYVWASAGCSVVIQASWQARRSWRSCPRVLKAVSVSAASSVRRLNSDELPALASLAKSYYSEATRRRRTSRSTAASLHWEHPAHLYFKRAKSSELLLGDLSYHCELLAQRIGV